MIRFLCKQTGQEIKTNWRECRGCRFYVKVFCPKYKLGVTATTPEFADWFHEHRIKEPEPQEQNEAEQVLMVGEEQ